MHRIDTSTAQKDKFGAGKNGFTNGDPATGRRATDLNSDMWDAVQEEICNAIESVGIPLDKSKHNQLALAISKAIEDGGFLKKSNNLSDVENKIKALLNLGGVAKSGDTMTGKLNLPQTSGFGVNTDNALGGNSIAIGDSDTGIKQSADGVLDIYANGAQTFRFTPFEASSFMPIKYTVSGFPAGSGSFDEQLNSVAPFTQSNWEWTPSAGGRYVPVCKGISTRSGEGYTTAVSFGYLLNEKTSFAVPCIHAIGGGVNVFWQFDPNSKTTICPGGVNAGGAELAVNGNISGAIWGGLLSDFLNAQFAARDTNINSRATWDWINNALAQRDVNIETRATRDWVNKYFIGDVRLSNEMQTGPQPFFYSIPAGCVMTGLDVAGDSNASANIGYRSLQKYVNGTWHIVGTL